MQRQRTETEIQRKSTAEKQRRRTEEKVQQKMQQCTYVMPGMLAKTPSANDLMCLLLRSRVPEVVAHDPYDDKTALLYIRIYAKPLTHAH